MAAARATARAGNAPPQAQQTALTTASVFTVETCADVVSDLFRYGGGRVLSLSSPMQRYLRDVLAARQHVALTEEFYEAAGRERIESAGHAPGQGVAPGRRFRVASGPQDVDRTGDDEGANRE